MKGPAMRLLQHSDLKPQKGIRYSAVHLKRLELAGKFPRRVPLGPGAYGYLESEVDAYLQQKVDERDAGVAA
jgi:prophage regulatory protein